MEKVPMGIRYEKSSKDMASSMNLVSTIGAQASPKMGGTEPGVRNETRRFYIYVQNRVNRIRTASSPSQWNFIPTNRNLTDLATRLIHGLELQNSI